MVVRLPKAKRTDRLPQSERTLGSESSDQGLVLPDPPAAKHDIVAKPGHVANATGIARIAGTFRRAVSAVVLGAMLGSALFGCGPAPNTPKKPPTQVEQAAEAASRETSQPSAIEVARAEAIITRRPAGAQYLERIKDEKTLVSIGRILERYVDNRSFVGARADVGVAENIVGELQTYSVSDDRVAAFVEVGSRLPEDVVRNAIDLYELSRVFESPSFYQGLDAARAFADKHQYRPSPFEIEKLGRMNAEERLQLDRLIGELHEAGGFQLSQAGSLEVLGDLLPITNGQPKFMGVGDVFDFTAPRYELDLGQLLEGARELRDKCGVSLDASRLHLAGLLAAGNVDQQAVLRGLLTRVLLTGHPDDGSGLAITAGNLAVQGGVEWTRTDDLIKKLGRKLTVPELHLILETEELPGTVSDLLPAALEDFLSQANETVYLKDLYTLASLDEANRKLSRQELVSSLSERIISGTGRADSNAWYVESFDQLHRYMTLGELHKVRLLSEALSSPEFLAQIAEVIEADLQDRTAEVGGLLRFDGKAVHIEAHESERKGNDLQYVLPRGIDVHHMLASFHIHGGDTPGGSPEAAGPSGSARLTRSDLGSSYLGHRDDVVITFLEPGKVNVDFYNGRGVVVDLGNYELPSAPEAATVARTPRS